MKGVNLTRLGRVNRAAGARLHFLRIMVPTEYSKNFRHVRNHIYIKHAILTICDLIGHAILTKCDLSIGYSNPA